MTVGAMPHIGGVYLSATQLFRVDLNLLPVLELLVVHRLQIRSEDVHRFCPDDLTVTDTHHWVIRTDFDQNIPLVIAERDDVAVLGRHPHRPTHSKVVFKDVQHSI